MKPEIVTSLSRVAQHAFCDSFVVGAVQAMFSSWMIALMVWLLPAAGPAAAFIIVALTYVVR